MKQILITALLLILLIGCTINNSSEEEYVVTRDIIGTGSMRPLIDKKA